MKIKIFNSGNETSLQGEINEWFAKNPNISITEILQSESQDQGWSLTITVIYLEFGDGKDLG